MALRCAASRQSTSRLGVEESAGHSAPAEASHVELASCNSSSEAWLFAENLLSGVGGVGGSGLRSRRSSPRGPSAARKPACVG